MTSIVPFVVSSINWDFDFLASDKVFPIAKLSLANPSGSAKLLWLSYDKVLLLLRYSGVSPVEQIWVRI